ncbi:MAG: hypothetical protein ABFD96_05805 [Armatimonadia bacterium]
MKRLIITGKNSQVPREAFSRPVSNRPRVLPFSSSNCDTGLSSGHMPDTAAGGTRRPKPVVERSASTLDDRYFWLDVCVIFAIGMATVALMTAMLL